jgi:hypothetical protein
MSTSPTTTVTCLDGEEEIKLDEEAQPGDLILCGLCEAEMELVSGSTRAKTAQSAARSQSIIQKAYRHRLDRRDQNP